MNMETGIGRAPMGRACGWRVLHLSVTPCCSGGKREEMKTWLVIFERLPRSVSTLEF